jgi:hypothetical protein
MHAHLLINLDSKKKYWKFRRRNKETRPDKKMDPNMMENAQKQEQSRPKYNTRTRIATFNVQGKLDKGNGELNRQLLINDMHTRNMHVARNKKY